MDDKMIIDFINNVQPDMSYGTSDGMTRAMVESAENMAVVNDYITESTYEVYTEAEEDKDNKQGFFSKVKTKIHSYFIIFVNLVKKAIEKVKGFFLSIKRKLTIAMAKALRGAALAMHSYVKPARSDDSDPIANKTIGNVYYWNDKKISRLTKIITAINGNFNSNPDTFDASYLINKFNKDFNVESLLIETPLTLNTVKEFYSQLKKNIVSMIDNFFNTTMKTYNTTLSILQKKEKEVKDKYSNNPKELSNELKDISKKVHLFNSIRFTAAQLIASAAVKMYKRAFTYLDHAKKNK